MSNTSDALSMNAEGVRLHQNGDHAGAIKTLTEAIENDPNQANIYRNRADAYRAADKIQEADADAAKADELARGRLDEELEAHKTTFLQKLWNFVARES